MKLLSFCQDIGWFYFYNKKEGVYLSRTPYQEALGVKLDMISGNSRLAFQ